MLLRVTNALVPVAMAAFGLLAGCSSVGASAIRTGPLRLPPNTGGVALYSGGEEVRGADLGVVEVHGAESEGTIETLVPLFVKKVAQIGGDTAIIESVHASFEVLSRPYVETTHIPCGFGMSCVGTRVYPVHDSIMVVSIRGHAVNRRALEAVAPRSAP